MKFPIWTIFALILSLNYADATPPQSASGPVGDDTAKDICGHPKSSGVTFTDSAALKQALDAAAKHPKVDAVVALSVYAQEKWLVAVMTCVGENIYVTCLHVTEHLVELSRGPEYQVQIRSNQGGERLMDPGSIKIINHPDPEVDMAFLFMLAMGGDDPKCSPLPLLDRIWMFNSADVISYTFCSTLEEAVSLDRKSADRKPALSHVKLTYEDPKQAFVSEIFATFEWRDVLDFLNNPNRFLFSMGLPECSHRPVSPFFSPGCSGSPLIWGKLIGVLAGTIASLRLNSEHEKLPDHEREGLQMIIDSYTNKCASPEALEFIKSPEYEELSKNYPPLEVSIRSVYHTLFRFREISAIIAELKAHGEAYKAFIAELKAHGEAYKALRTLTSLCVEQACESAVTN